MIKTDQLPTLTDVVSDILGSVEDRLNSVSLSVRSFSVETQGGGEFVAILFYSPDDEGWVVSQIDPDE